MNFKTFGGYFLSSFIVIFLYRIASFYFGNYESGHQTIPNLNGVVQSASNAYNEWFIKSLVGNIWPLIGYTAIYAFCVGLILYFISKRDKKAQETLGKNIFSMSLRPSIIKVVSTLILAPISYFGLLTFGFLGFGHTSAVVWTIAGFIRTIFAFPQIIINSLGIRFSMFETHFYPYVAMLVHVMWIYILVCFIAYLITLRKAGRQAQINTTVSTPTI